MSRPHPFRATPPVIFNPQPKQTTYRSEKHRRHVAALACVCCGRHGPSQAAHANFGKGFGIKASDALLFPLCPHCHQFHDQGGVQRDERRRLELGYVDHTRAELIAVSLWSTEVEIAYMQDVQALREVVSHA